MGSGSRKKMGILNEQKIFVESILRYESMCNGKTFIPFICPVFGSYNGDRSSSTSFDLWILWTRDSDDVVP